MSPRWRQIALIPPWIRDVKANLWAPRFMQHAIKRPSDKTTSHSAEVDQSHDSEGITELYRAVQCWLLALRLRCTELLIAETSWAKSESFTFALAPTCHRKNVLARNIYLAADCPTSHSFRSPESPKLFLTRSARYYGELKSAHYMGQSDFQFK